MTTYSILTADSLRKARKGRVVSYRGAIYAVAKVSFKRDRVWLTPLDTFFIPKWDSRLREYIVDLARDVVLPTRELTRRMIQHADRLRKAANIAYRQEVKKVRLETYGHIFYR